MLNGWASLPSMSPGERHSGGCLPFAVDYCQRHPGCQLIIGVHNIDPQHLGAHAFVCDHGVYVDNMHSRVNVAHMSRIGFLNTTGEFGWRIFRVIDYDHQTADDRHVIEVLKRTVL
jgi:hypothetical protein